VWRTLDREERLRAWEVVAERAGSPLTRGECWMVSRVSDTGTRSMDVMAEVSQTPVEVVQTVAERLRDRGMVTIADGSASITPAGTAEADRLLAAQRSILHGIIEDWPGGEPDVEELLDDIARRLRVEDTPDDLVSADER
jgi:hypothetical protein